MKKGFTLVEVLAVIVLLGILVTLLVPVVNSSIKKSRIKSQQTQISEIIKSTKTYMTDTDISTDSTMYISLSTLKTQGYLKNKDTIDLTNKESMNDYCVRVTWNGVKYDYAMVSSCEGDEVPVVVTVPTPEDPVVVPTEEDPVPTGGTKLITQLSEQYSSTNTTGLLKDGSTYYYQGTFDQVQHNYIWFGGFEWQVIEFNDSSILMQTTRPATAIQVAKEAWDTQEKYANSYLNIWLNSLGDDGVFYKSFSESDKAKIIDNVFRVGLSTTGSVASVSSITYTAKAGVIDYAQYLRSGPKGVGMGGFLDHKHVMTIGNCASNERYGQITYVGFYANVRPPFAAEVFPVIRISNINITKGDGTEENPFREDITSTNTANMKVGEYVSIPNPNCGGTHCRYRVVSKDSDSLKITLDGYLDNPTKFGISTTYTANNTVDTDSTSFNSDIPSSIIYSGTKSYYTGTYSVDEISYIGQNYTAIKSRTYTGLNGIPVVGEMFSSDDIYSGQVMWTMNPQKVGVMSGIGIYGISECKIGDSYYIRPITYIKSGTTDPLTIKGGQGFAFDPFILNK